MNGWLSPGRVFYEFGAELVAAIGPARDKLVAAGYIEVSEFHGLAHFRGHGDRLIAAWHKMVELAGDRGLAIEQVTSCVERPSPSSEQPRP